MHNTKQYPIPLQASARDNYIIRITFASCKSFQFGLKFSFVVKSLTLSQTSPGFYVSAVHVFKKHCGKRGNCSQPTISPFPTVFSTCFENFLPFSLNLKLSSANSFSLEESKICHLGKS